MYIYVFYVLTVLCVCLGLWHVYGSLRKLLMMSHSCHYLLFFLLWWCEPNIGSTNWLLSWFRNSYMRACPYMLTCMRRYVSCHTNTYRRAYIHIYIYMYIFTYRHACVHTCTHMFVCTDVRPLAGALSRTHTYVHYIYTCTHAHMYQYL